MSYRLEKIRPAVLQRNSCASRDTQNGPVGEALGAPHANNMPQATHMMLKDVVWDFVSKQNATWGKLGCISIQEPCMVIPYYVLSPKL